MPKKPVERINFKGDSAEELKRLQDSVIRAVNPLAALPLLDGQIIGPIALGTVFQSVNHLLSRQYLGWIVVRNNAAAIVTEDFNSISQSTSISLKASVAATVYLWVF